jgi:hypothetical protein
MPEYFSYAEQTAHYFRRPHSAPPRGRISSAAAWKAADFDSEESWRQRLRPGEVDELEAAIEVAVATDKQVTELRAEDFPLPTLHGEIRRWGRELEQGRGFQVVSGLPVERWSRQETEIFFWGLGLHLGRPGAQNPQGDLLGEVRDTGEDEADPFVRLYRTRSEIAYHCDAADVVGLLCVRSAPKGGTSRIASSVAVYNTLQGRRPELARRLFDSFPLDIRNEDASGGLRYIEIQPCCFAENKLRTFYHSDYFRSAQRHPELPRFSENEKALLDLYDEIAADSDHRLDMDLEPGDIQWLSNHSIVHSRTRYEDLPDAGTGRLLLRLWVSLEQ